MTMQTEQWTWQQGWTYETARETINSYSGHVTAAIYAPSPYILCPRRLVMPPLLGEARAVGMVAR